MRYVVALLVVGCLASIGGVATKAVLAQGRQKMVTTIATVPQVNALSETPSTQVKGGVSITAAPTPFETVRQPGCSYSFITGFASNLFVPNGVSPATHEHMEESRFDALTVRPDHLSFVVTIRNQMNRVFRGAGAVVQFAISGKVLGIDQPQYAEFLGALIVPQGQAQITLGGPAFDAIASGTSPTVLAVSLADVVVAIDDAGNVTKRDNFQWLFSVQSKTVTEDVPSTTRRVWIPNAEMNTIAERTPGGGAQLRRRQRPTCVAGAIQG